MRSGSLQAQNDLLVFFLDWAEQHVGTGDGFANRGSIRCIVLAATASHAVRGDEFGRHEFDGVAVLPELPCPVALLLPFAESSPLPRDGEVPFIR